MVIFHSKWRPVKSHFITNFIGCDYLSMLGCKLTQVKHYDDVIMNTIASQITSLMIVYSTFYSDADQSKHQSSASLAFVWGIHRDRWIPRTKGQLRGKCFHLMTSSWKALQRNEVHISWHVPHVPTCTYFHLVVVSISVFTTCRVTQSRPIYVTHVAKFGTGWKQQGRTKVNFFYLFSQDTWRQSRPMSENVTYAKSPLIGQDCSYVTW